MNQNLLILGSESYGMAAKEIAEAEGRFAKVVLFQDCREAATGTLADLPALAELYHFAAAAAESSAIRMRLIQRLRKEGFEIVTLIHPRAWVSPSATLGEGCIVEPMAVVGCEADLGTGTLVEAGSLVGHHSVVGSGCRLKPGSVVEADAIVPGETTLESGQVFGSQEVMIQDAQGKIYRVAQVCGSGQDQWAEG